MYIPLSLPAAHERASPSNLEVDCAGNALDRLHVGNVDIDSTFRVRQGTALHHLIMPR